MAYNLRAMLLVEASFPFRLPSDRRVYVHLSGRIDHNGDRHHVLARLLVLSVQAPMLDHHRIPQLHGNSRRQIRRSILGRILRLLFNLG